MKEFSSLILDIQNMSEEDKLFNFIFGLQRWAQLEIRRHNVQDLPNAIVVAESLVDYKFNRDTTDSSSSLNLKKNKGKEKKGNWEKEGKKQESDKGK